MKREHTVPASRRSRQHQESGRGDGCAGWGGVDGAHEMRQTGEEIWRQAEAVTS